MSYEVWENLEGVELGGVDGDLPASGDGWHWTVPQEYRNAYGADRRLWGDEAPPVTRRLAGSLHPLERAHYDGRGYYKNLVSYAESRLNFQPVEGWTGEDLAIDALDRMEAYPRLEVESSEWTKLTRRVVRNKISDLREVSTIRRESDAVARMGLPTGGTVDYDSPFFNSLPEEVEQHLSPRDAQIVSLRYVDGMSSKEIASVMKMKVDAVDKVLSRSRSKLEEVFLSL